MGLGYIGLPTAIISSQHGINVCGVDINPKVVEKTNRGELHIVEPGLQDLLKKAVDRASWQAPRLLKAMCISSLCLLLLRRSTNPTSVMWNQPLRL